MASVTLADLGSALVTGTVTAGDIAEGMGLRSPSKVSGDRATSKRRNTKQATLLSPSHAGVPAGERSPSRRRTTRRNTRLQTNESLRADLTMTEWATSTMLGTPTSAAQGGIDGDAEGGQLMSRRDKKRFNTEKKLTMIEQIDDFAESAVHKTFEQPWYLDTCMTQPTCQRVCFPADNATRHRKQGQDEGGSSQAAGGHADGHKALKIGVPDFVQAGFSLVPVEDMDLVDPTVASVLGLQLALHRKTSVQRFCLKASKSKMANGVGVNEVRGLIRALKRCDHVNVLTCHEVFEDADTIYFMYEYFPCCTLRYLFESHNWSQEQLVNIARECCAGVAHASSVGLLHLGWTMSHILLPASVLHGDDPVVAKVYGFGHMGILHLDSIDHFCWAPELLERYSAQERDAGNFIMKAEAGLRMSCDSWSLGVVIYALVARQLPMLTEQLILLKKWQFTLAIDMVDSEAKSLIEGFLNPNSEKRLKADRALHHEWIRRRWRPPTGHEIAFQKAEDFVLSPLPKRLFGRFLTRFLDAEHLRKIAKAFYTLDAQGTGNLTIKELQHAARSLGRPLSVANAIFTWLSVPGTHHITLTRFAEAFAEEVIDGRALRHAFESLDDDGSEEVSPQELFDALSSFHNDLTLDEVVQHIESAELEACDGEAEVTKDHQIDYGEFCQLFPVRVQRMKDLAERTQTERALSEDLTCRFRSTLERVRDWLHKVDEINRTVAGLSAKTLERSDIGKEAAGALKKEFNRLDDCLKNPPGPLDAYEFNLLLQKKKKEHEKKEHDKEKALEKGQKVEEHHHHHHHPEMDLLGFDSFLQDIAATDSWHSLLSQDQRNLKHALNTANKVTASVDQFKAHDAAQSVTAKINQLLKKARVQLEEYDSFVEAMGEPEVGIMSTSGGAQLSGRGLRARHGEEDDDMLEGNVDGDDTGGNPITRFIQDVTQRLTSR